MTFQYTTGSLIGILVYTVCIYNGMNPTYTTGAAPSCTNNSCCTWHWCFTWHWCCKPWGRGRCFTWHWCCKPWGRGRCFTWDWCFRWYLCFRPWDFTVLCRAQKNPQTKSRFTTRQGHVDTWPFLYNSIHVIGIYICWYISLRIYHTNQPFM